MASVAHLVREWLPRTQTFIFNLLVNQRRWRPVIFAGDVANLGEFPADPLVRLKSAGLARPRRALRRLRARAWGFETTYDERLFRLGRRHRCALVHAHFGPMGWRALPARRRLEVPLLTSFYGHDLASRQVEPNWTADYAELFSEGTLFLCEGPAMAERLVGIGAPRERVRIAKIGIDLGLLPFQPRRRDRRPRVVVQAGRLVEKKGVDVSIRAFAAARGELGESELWLVGDGPLRGELEGLARELGVGEAVRFLGSLPYDGYRAALARAQIGIQPSRTAADGDTEGGAPTVLLEMQASGMPVVGTRHADIPQVVAAPEELAAEEDVDGVAAALVRLATLADGAWSDRLRAGRELVEREHDARVVARRVEDHYSEALDAAA